MKIILTGNSFPFGEGHAYGGERILGYLTQELIKLGHEVYLFAREGTNVSEATDYIPIGPLCDDRDVHYEAVKEYVAKTGIEPDIYFCGYFGKGDQGALERWPYVELIWCRWSHAKFEFPKVKPFNVVSYSNLLQQDMIDSGVPTTMIHYGLPKDLYKFQPDKEDYAVWIAKAEGGKAPRLGAELARAAGLKLVFMCPPYNTGVMWDQVLPYVDNKNIFWVRGVDDQMKYEIMSKAKVFLYTNSNEWREHAGIVLLESLAMGTPVVGMNRINQDCAIVTDKIIEHGKHGFILNYYDSNNLSEILSVGVPLINRIHEIDPIDCREQFEKRFTADLMARRYEWLFERVAAGERFGTVEVPF